jgi:hypothetical protein
LGTVATRTRVSGNIVRSSKNQRSAAAAATRALRGGMLRRYGATQRRSIGSWSISQRRRKRRISVEYFQAVSAGRPAEIRLFFQSSSANGAAGWVRVEVVMAAVIQAAVKRRSPARSARIVV